LHDKMKLYGRNTAMKRNSFFIAALLWITLSVLAAGGYGEDAKTFNVVFETNGGGSVAALRGITAIHGITSIAAEPVTYKPMNDFEGWFTDNGTFLKRVKFPYTVKADVTFYAKWAVNKTMADYYGDETASPLIEPAELKAMLDDPAVAARLIILDGSATAAASQTIAPRNGAVVYQMFAYTRPVREEGPITVNYAMDFGESFENNVKSKGITKDSIVILTSDWTRTGAGGNIPGIWWQFNYWGFSKKNVKVLNGGNAAYRAAYGTSAMGGRTARNAPQPSNFSLKDLPGDRIGGTPYSVGNARGTLAELVESVKNGDYEAGRKIFLSTLVNAMVTRFKTGDGANVTINAYGHGFMGKVKGQKFMKYNPNGTCTSRDCVNPEGWDYYVTNMENKTDPDDAGVIIPVYKYKTYEQMRNLFLDRDIDKDTPIFPDDRSIRILTHCGTGTTTLPFWFAITMAGYYNAVPYAGSGAEFFTMAAYRVQGDNTIVTGTDKAANDPANPFPGNPYPGELVNPPPPWAARNALGMLANAMIDVPTQFLRLDEANHRYIRYDGNSKEIGPLEITPENGFLPGAYKGIWTWDMTKYADYLVMVYNADPVGYSSAKYAYYPEYVGNGDGIREADLEYKYPGNKFPTPYRYAYESIPNYVKRK